MKLIALVYTISSYLFQVTFAGECLRPLYYSGCKDDSQCANINGNKVECKLSLKATEASPKQCLCPDGVDCTKTTSDRAAQYESCMEKQCSDYGIVDFPGSQGCAEKLHCFATVTVGVEAKTSFCHTCTSCRQHLHRYNCALYCQDMPTNGTADTSGSGSKDVDPPLLPDNNETSLTLVPTINSTDKSSSSSSTLEESTLSPKVDNVTNPVTTRAPKATPESSSNAPNRHIYSTSVIVILLGMVYSVLF